jgi:predicted phosphodiesterase
LKSRSIRYYFAVLILLTGFLLAVPVCAVAKDEVSGHFKNIPYVIATTHNTTVIRWYSDTFNPDNLLYANESFFNKTGSYDHTVTVNKTFPSNQVFLTGLESGTRYHYALQQEGIPLINQSFMTFPENGACSFIVYGDTREQAPYFTQLERHRIVADRIAGESNISFVINTGDLVSNPDDPEEWDRFFTAGKMLFATTTYAAVRGNHDSNSSLSEDLFGTDGMYSIDCGDVHIAVLDSNNDARLSLAEQARRLKTYLSSTDKWKIVILHHPLYTSEENHFGGFENLQKVFEPIFFSENVSVIFNGHVHAYERIEKSGITYITEGRGGAPAYSLNATKMMGSEKNLENTLGYSRVTIDPTTESLSIDVIQVADVSSDLRNVTQILPVGTIIDRINLRKQDQLPNHRVVSSKLQSPLSGLFSCKNNMFSSEYNFSSGPIPSCLLHRLLE